MKITKSQIRKIIRESYSESHYLELVASDGMHTGKMTVTSMSDGSAAFCMTSANGKTQNFTVPSNQLQKLAEFLEHKVLGQPADADDSPWSMN